MDREGLRLQGCYHEAGHAVMSLMRGHEVHYAMVETPGEPKLRDYTQHRFRLYVPETEWMSRMEFVAVNVAGFYAQWFSHYGSEYQEPTYEEFMDEHRDYTQEELDEMGDNGDTYNHLAAIESAHGAEQGNQTYDMAHNAVRLLVRDRWGTVEAVALALCEEGYLGERRLRDLYERG